MNSVYKRYCIITLIAMLVCVGTAVSTATGLIKEIDKVNVYAAEYGHINDLKLDRLSWYITDSEGAAEHIYPDFDFAGEQIRENDGEAIWLIALVIMVAMLYLYERGSATSDFCAVLPVKQRSRFIVRLACVLVVPLVLMLVNIWSVHLFNTRVDACNITCKVMEMEKVYPVELTAAALWSGFFSKAVLGTILLLLAEFTGKVYLPPCILVLAFYAIAGSISGIYNYLNFYFNIELNISFLRFIALNYFGFASDSQQSIVFLTAVTIVNALWGLFLSGRGDMSRRGRVFRFKWVENIAMVCIVICAMLCSFVLMFVFELNYIVGAGVAAFIMIIVGIAAYFICRRIILLLGR